MWIRYWNILRLSIYWFLLNWRILSIIIHLIVIERYGIATWLNILIVHDLIIKISWWSYYLRCCKTYISILEVNFDFKVKNMLFLVERKGNILHLYLSEFIFVLFKIIITLFILLKPYSLLKKSYYIRLNHQDK